MRPADTTGAAGAGPPGAERFKEVKGMKKRIVGTLMALLLAATVLPPGAISVTSADVTTGLVTTAYAEGEQNHCICGAEHNDGIKTHTRSDVVNYNRAITVSSRNLYYGNTQCALKKWDSSKSQYVNGTKLSDAEYYVLPAGNYYIDNDITTIKTILIESGTVNICLNGKKITLDSDYHGNAVFKVLEGATLNLTDCAETSTISAVSSGRGVVVYGTLNLYSGNITKSDRQTGAGAGVYVGTSGVFNMYGGKITNNRATNTGGGGVYNLGTFNMYEGAEISRNYANTSTSLNAGGVYNKGGTFTMYGGMITNNGSGKANNGFDVNCGGGVYVYGGSFIMKGGTISGNTARESGGGVNVKNGATFTMENGVIGGATADEANTAPSGGGVYLDGTGVTFDMKNGTISSNVTSRNNGGGVFVYKNATFTMRNGSIANNVSAKHGGGVYVQDGTFNMDGGLISGNAASESNYADGGGVFVIGSFTMSNGTISGNKAYRGAGVQVGDYYPNGSWGAGTFTMTGGIIGGTTADAANIATYGGGVNVWSAGTFDLRGGSIIGNEANGTVDESGGGVHSNGTFNVSGDPIVKSNTREIQGSTYADNVDSSDKAINVVGVLRDAVEIVVNRTSKTKITGVATYYSAIPNDDESVTLTAGSDCAHSNVSTDWSKDENGHWRVCSDCQANVDSAEHTLEMKWDTTQHWSKCSVCGYESAKASHSGGEANCLSEAVCTTCNQKYGEKNPSNHVKDDTEWERTDTTHKEVYKCCGVDATAAENHTWENGECSVCKMVCVHGQISYVQTETTHQQKCDTCGKYLQESAVAHEFSNGVCSICGFGCTHEGGEAKCNALAVCTKCGNTYGSLDFNNHAESLSYEFKSSSTQHWNEYPCCHARENVAAHVYDNDTDTTCNTCGYVRTISGGGESGGDTPTPTPTPEAPRYYYSSGSGSTGAGGLSAVQNDPNGKSATDYNGGIYGLIFKSYANFSSFQGVQVDGKTIAPANYIAEEGSIEVYLKAVYLRTLAAGKHTVTILSSEGNATAEFTVGGVVSAPKTVDAGALAYLGLALSSYVGTALVTRRKKEF